MANGSPGVYDLPSGSQNFKQGAQMGTLNLWFSD